MVVAKKICQFQAVFSKGKYFCRKIKIGMSGETVYAVR